MDGHIRYDGKMTDLIPAQVFITVANFGRKPKQYTKVHNYLNENYPRRKVKVDNIEIMSIEETKSMKGVKRGTTIIRCCESPSKLYDYKVRTFVEVAGDYFTVIQEGKINVSEVVSQVIRNNMKWIDHNGMVVVEV